MSQLVAYYDENPVEVRGDLEIQQLPIASSVGSRSVDGVVRTSLVYVCVHREPGTLLVPFGRYDDWSLRDRYNEAIRIMNTLGASSITCETLGEGSVRRGIRGRLRGGGGSVSQRRVVNSNFDYRYEGSGSEPGDPRPLLWPDEPGFAAAVTSVLVNGATNVVINVNSSRTHAVDGVLGVQLKKCGFELGGMSEHSSAASLHISATFPRSTRRRR